jgi:hypothetical protein
MSINIEQLQRVLTVLAMVRSLLTEFPTQPDLIAIRDELIALAKATRT